MREFGVTSTTLVECALAAMLLAVVFVTLRAGASRAIAVAAVIIAAVAFLLLEQMGVVVGFAAVGLAVLFQRRRGLRIAEHSPHLVAIESTGILAGLATYISLRKLIEAHFHEAHANALRVIDFERSLGILTEHRVQDAFWVNDAVMAMFNHYYEFAYLGTTASVLLWLFLVDRPNYRLFRNALAASTVLALVTIAAFPVAPPRMIPEAGVIDSVIALGGTPEFANEFAAVPSLHVGWMVLSGFMLARSIGGRRGALIGVIPGASMALTVVVTGNHYWIDGVVGTAFSLGPALSFMRTGGSRRPDELPMRGARRPGTAVT